MLEPGHVICDMHGGLDLSSLNNPAIKERVRIDSHSDHAWKFIQDTVRYNGNQDFTYHNKLFVVLGDAYPHAGYIGAYSYDGLRFEMIRFECDD